MMWKHGINMIDKISFGEKYLLTPKEASIYFGVGENKVRELIENDKGYEFSLFNGNRRLIKRRKFEKWIDSQVEL